MKPLLLEVLTTCRPREAGALEQAVDQALRANRSAVEAVLDTEPDLEESFLSGLAERVGERFEPLLQPSDMDAVLLKRLCGPQLAIQQRVVPLRLEQDPESGAEYLVMAHYDPFDAIQRRGVNQQVDRPVRWVTGTRRGVLEALQRFYGIGADTFEEILATREADSDGLELKEEVNVLDDEDEEASVVKFVNQIIRQALAERATDIHVEPLDDRLQIRFRVDGVLRSVPVPDRIKTLQASVITRLKVMARLDIAERRLPQDGRISLQLDGQSIDVRVATIPTVEGETVSLRLLGQEQFTLERLGMDGAIRQYVDGILDKPNGIVLVTGPTGCGKSTTLYCFLSVLNQEERRVVTIEDPVENKLRGLIQIAVKPEINLTFANGLRSILRGDPNVIMVGEIRDLETAEIAVRASLTGHLVLSTLHTNDALGGIARLIDMGVEPFLVSAAVRAFMAQRLVRRLCGQCRQPVAYEADYLASLGLPAEELTAVYQAGPGCEACGMSGYRGRLAIYELCRVTPALADLISHGATREQQWRQARRDGYRSLREYGWEKVLQGETTLEEVLSVTDGAADEMPVGEGEGEDGHSHSAVPALKPEAS